MIPLFKVNMNSRSKLLNQVIKSGYIGQGKVVEEFEEAFYALNPNLPVKPLSVNSCTSAITMALTLCGVEPGTQVISTAQTCTASNLPVLHHYASIIWADINEFGLIDPEDVGRKITPETKAIIAVDWAGRFCDYNALKKFGIPIIQDAAHCLYVDPDNCGDYICWSFQAIKFLTTVDGGALMVPQDKYENAKLMRWFGLNRDANESFRCKQDIKIPGYKFQPHDVGSAIGLGNIENAKKAVVKSRKNAKYYCDKITNSDVILHEYDPTCNYWIYTLQLKNQKLRDGFIDYMKINGVSTSQVHARNDKHTVFKDSKIDLPNTEYFDKTQISIPNGFWVTKEQRKEIVRLINEFKMD
jgi:perosamine synthetase